MSALPVITAIGGVNAAGRISGHHSYARMVLDALPAKDRAVTLESLRGLMNIDPALETAALEAQVRKHTLIRPIESFDATRLPAHAAMSLRNADSSAPLTITVSQRQLPQTLPAGWRIVAEDGNQRTVEINGETPILVPDHRAGRVNSAGQLPSGFAPERLYQSRSHPRGLQITIYGASDALFSLGIDWQLIRNHIKPDQVAVYAGSGMSQLDPNGYGGMMQAHLMGKRVTAKQLPLGLPQMAADFVNAYVLGSVGSAGANIGACATFLYNLRQGIEDIQSGKRRFVMVGNAEAPIIPEIIEGYRTMGALAEDEALQALDPGASEPDLYRASRPFSNNCGFVLGESAVFTVLMDDELAMELGAPILGAVPDVFINADGYKKSIPSPGIGNYVTVGKALSTAAALIGEENLHRTWIQAHGTSTPQNRVTESHILNEMAKLFGMEHWHVGAVKAYLGHSLAPASGDQLAATLGVWQHGILPGIATIDHIADDVHQSNLTLTAAHTDIGKDAMQATLINSKGFGGNNATALILSPERTRAMLAKRHGKQAMQSWQQRLDATEDARAQHEAAATAGTMTPEYRFGDGVLDGPDLSLSREEIVIPGFDKAVSLAADDRYDDMV